MYGRYLVHYGVAADNNPPGRGSGRYPRGSGKRPFQHGSKTGIQNGIDTGRSQGSKHGIISDVLNNISESIGRKRLGPMNKTTGLYLRTDNLPVEKDIKNVNPLYKYFIPGTDSNCVPCTIALEARQRGYDVRAAFSTKGFSGSYQVAKAFPGGKFTSYGPTKVGKNLHEYWSSDKEKINKARTAALLRRNHKLTLSVIESLSSERNSRGAIFVDWGFGGGHAMSYDVVDGNLRILDGQNGKIYSTYGKIDAIFSRCVCATTYRFDGNDMNAKKVKEHTL